MSRVALSKPPQPTPDAKGAGVPERKIGSEALAASAKMRKSSIECLSAASFEAARGEQLGLPAEGPLKRRDGSSCKSTLNPLPGLGSSTHGTTLFVKEPIKSFNAVRLIFAILIFEVHNLYRWMKILKKRKREGNPTKKTPAAAASILSPTCRIAGP